MATRWWGLASWARALRAAAFESRFPPPPHSISTYHFFTFVQTFNPHFCFSFAPSFFWFSFFPHLFVLAPERLKLIGADWLTQG